MQKHFDDAELTRKIIGCAMKVHSYLGNGFPELIYQRALEIELEEQSLVFEREYEMPIYYRDRHIGTRRVDFFVEGISVELKALLTLENSHFAQAMNYLEALNIRTGLLINFGAPRLQFHRLTNKKYNSENSAKQSSAAVGRDDEQGSS